MEAARRGFPHVVSLLLEAGANVHAQDEQGRTVLFFACEQESDSHLEVVSLCCEAGADVNHTSAAGETAMIQVARLGHAKHAAGLLSRGAWLCMCACVLVWLSEVSEL